MARTMELLIELKGKLEKTYPEAVRKAAAEAGELQKKFNKLNEVKIKAEQYTKLADTIGELGKNFYQAESKAGKLWAALKNGQASVAQYKNQLDQARAAIAFMDKSANPEAYKAARASIAQLSAAYKAAQANVKVLGREFKQANDSAKAAGTAYYGNQAALRNLSTELQKAGFDTKNFASSQKMIQQEMDRTNQAFMRASKIQEQHDAELVRQAKANKNLSDKQQALYNAYGNFTNAQSMAETVMSPFVGAVKTAADFEQVMAKVKAITGSNTQEMAKLEAQAKALGSSTQFTMSQAGEAMTYLGMAGWKTEQILGGMPGLLNLAAAAGADLAQTADIVSDGMTALGMTAGQKIPNAFGQMVDSTTHFADVMAAASSNANTNVQMMGETFKYAASTAGALGYSIDDLGLATGLMANAGIKGSQAGTALRSIFTRMSTETDSAAQAMNMLGISMTEVGADGQEKMKSFTKVIQEMRGAFRNIDASKLTDMVEAMSGSKMKNKDAMIDMLNRIKANGGVLSEIDKVKFSNMLAGQEAMAGLLSLVMGSDEDFNKLFNSIQKCDGKSAEMAKTMTNTYAGAVTAYESALEGLKQSVGSTFLPVLTQAAKYAGAFASDLIKWTSEHKTLVQWVGILAGGLAGMAVLVTGVALAFAGWQFVTAQLMVMKGAIMGMRAAQLLWAGATGIVTAAQWLLNAALTANPIGLVIMGIAALIAIGYLLISNWEAVKAWFVLLWNDPKAAIDQFVGFLREKIGGAVDWVIERWNTLKSALAHPLDAAVNFVTTGSVVGGEVTAKTAQDYSLAGSQMSGADAMRGLREAGTNPQAVADAQQISSAMADASTNAQNYAANMEQAGAGIQQTTGYAMDFQKTMQQMPTVAQTGFTGLGEQAATAAQTVNTNMQQIPTGIQQTFNGLPPIAQTNVDAMVTEFNKITEKCQPGAEAFIQAANAWGQQAYENMANWAGQMAQVVVDKLSQAWAQISAQFNAGLNVHVTTSGAGVAQNAEGGIYKQGAFLTTFAEKGPEAAIPLDGSTRAISLWNQAGEILGLLPKNQQPTAMEAVVNMPPMIGGMAEAKLPDINIPREQSTSVEVARQLSPAISSMPEMAVPKLDISALGAGIAQNAEGGIYKQGAFLTTFAEKGPEAAIPLDGSQRAVSLWSKAGEMLGLLPKNQKDTQKMAERAQSAPTSGLGNIINSILPMKDSIQLPSIVNMVEALPPELGTIADAIAPPTEAQMAAAPMALEPIGREGSFEINFNPQITINGNADSDTVAQMNDSLARLKAELLREVRRELGGMMDDRAHNKRRVSLAT